MRPIRILLMAALILWLPASAHTQEPPSSPHEEARRILRQRLSADEKRRANWAQASPTPTNGGEPTYNEIVLPDGARVRVNLRVNKWPIPLRVGAIKLLAPGVGWAAAGPGLIWTTDNGVHWKDITPWHSRSHEGLGRVFFLDRSRAWMTINEDVAASNESHYAIASTTDSGSTWTRRQFTLRGKDYGISLLPLRGSAGDIAFADPLHGWMSVGFSGETMNTGWGFLLTTSDGGRNWSRAPDPPELDEMLLVSPHDGWMYSPYDEQGLYLTKNGARSWKKIAPKVAGIEVNWVNALPTFYDSNHGFLPVRGSSRQGSIWKWALGLLATSDGGRTWKLDRAVVNIDETRPNRFRASTVAGSEWIFAASFNHMPVLTELGAGVRFDAGPKADPAYGKCKAADQISFVSAREGWVVIGDGQLLSTVDGGKTWTDITPDPDLI
jgi:photosystem II stability/assembly factor-like uncharacterized protein